MDEPVCEEGNSPINADGTQIEDAGCTHHYIQSDKDVTVDLAKAPLSHYLEEKNINKWQLTAIVNMTKPPHLPSKGSTSVEIVFVLCSKKQSLQSSSPDLFFHIISTPVTEGAGE